MNYLSVCSGIEAASTAWKNLNWNAVGFSEIEPFPSAVLSHHYPTVNNYGDINGHSEWKLPPIDILVGGTPCQSFSIAGLRKGLEDPRGNLMLTYLRIIESRKPRWIVWENVPGVLSSNGGRDFATFVTSLGNMGYGWAYRVLDSQWFGVAQRRKRVFVIGCLGNAGSAAKVLFESESLSRHPAPSREKKQGTATSTIPSVAGSLDTECGGGKLTHQSVANGHILGEWQSPNGKDIVGAMRARDYKGIGNDDLTEGRGLAVAIGTDCYNGSITGDVAATMGTSGSSVNASDPTVMHAFRMQAFGEYADDQTASTMKARDYKDATDLVSVTTMKAVGTDMFNGAITGDPTAYAFDSISSNSMKSSNPISGCNQVNISKALDTSRGLDPTCNQGGIGIVQANSYGTDLYNGAITGDIAVPLTNRADGTGTGPTVMQTMAVRRLTPIECERLQGFPDKYTEIPWRGKTSDQCPDGPRYKALGNSMTVPVMRWIGERIAEVDSTSK